VFPDNNAGLFPNRNATAFPDNNVETFPVSSVAMFHGNSATRFQSRNATKCVKMCSGVRCALEVQDDMDIGDHSPIANPSWNPRLLELLIIYSTPPHIHYKL